MIRRAGRRSASRAVPSSPATLPHRRDPDERNQRGALRRSAGERSRPCPTTPSDGRCGYTALTFDPTGFGESDGTPRGRYDPHRVIDDYSAAVNHLVSRPDVDPDRVGIVGVCMGGGYAVSLGARDKRLKAVVSIAGGYDIGGTFQQTFGVQGFADYVKMIKQWSAAVRVGEVAYIPTIARPDEDVRSRRCRTRRRTATTTGPAAPRRRTGRER